MSSADNAELNGAGYPMIFMRSRDPLLIADAETGTLQDANDAAIAFLGYDLAELQQKTITDLLDPPSREKIRPFLSGPHLEQSETFQLVALCQDGTAIPIEWGSIPFLMHDRPMLLIHKRDISKRLQTEEQLRRMMHETETLKRVNQIVSARGGLTKNLGHVLDLSREVFRMEAGAIYLKGLSGDHTLRLIVQRGLPDTLVAELRTLPEDVSQCALSQQRTAELELRGLSDLAGRPLSNLLKSHGFSYLVTTVIETHEGSIGMLGLLAAGDVRLGEQDLYLLRRIGQEIGEAVVHQQLHEQTRRRLELMRAFQAISRHISLSQDPEETFALIGQESMAAMGADRFGLYLVEPGTDRVRQAWTIGLSQAYVDAIDALYSEVPGSEAIAHRQPRLITDVLNDPTMAPLHDLVRREGFRSVGLFPLVSLDQIIGLVGYYYDSVQTFPPEEVEIAQAFANELAVFVQNYRLLMRLREAESWQRLILETTGEAVITADEENRIVDANLAACEMFGYDRDELLGRPVVDLVKEEHRERHAMGIERLRDRGLVRRHGLIRSEGQRKDGETFPMEASMGSFTVGGRRYVTAFIRDRSEVTQLEARLRQAQRMEAVGTLAGGVAHDFNNILTGVIGYIELAMMKLPSDHPVRYNLQKVKELGERAATLTRQLLAFSRRQVLEVRPLALNQVVEELTSFLNRVIGEDVSLRLIPGADLWAVRADRAALEQILMNLCVNSRDAMPQGGELLIETANVVLDEDYRVAHPWAVPGRYVMLAVSDTGVGMDAETMEHIFEPFFTTKEVGKGSGLGLAMVYGLVKQHDGLIHVYSEVGEGTTFKIYLPAELGLEAEQIPLGVEKLTPPAGHGTVLVVEDEAVLRDLMASALGQQGYSVLLAANGREALQTWEENRDVISLVIADVVMPEMGGRELYDHVREQASWTPFLFISGYSVNGIHQHFLLERGLEFLQKPFTPAQLLRRVKDILSGGTLS
jgi:PAS domain S-box-containing protein